MPEILLRNEPIPYIIVRSRRRSIAASILSDGTLAVKAPVLIPEFIIKQFLRIKEDWIIDHIVKRRRNGLKQLIPTIDKLSDTSEYVNFFSNRIQIVVSESDLTKTTRLYRVKDSFQIILPPGLTAFKREKEICTEIHNWYKKNSKNELIQRVQKYSEITDMSYNKVTVKDVTSHWGSCSVEKNLNFNYRLGMLPLEIADYVIVHELCHTVEMNHSQSFWDLVTKYCPNYKALRKELKSYQFL